ncbi:MAG: transcription initiation factor IIB [Candelina submexicana]|nr:MAG: transcription initiation factor IIB [Candelina submexicana]
MASQNLSPGAVPETAPTAPQEEEWKENLNTQVICRECKEIPPNIVEEFSSGDMVCGSCGLVLGDRIVDTRSEWRTFSNDDQGNDDPSRVGDGANPLLNGSQLQTSISFGDGGSGRSRDLHRAQNKSTHDKSTQSLLAAYKQIGAYCDVYQISKTASDTAKQYYKQVDDAKAFKGKTQDAIIAGCLFIACRQNKVPRTFREIYALTKVSKKDIGRSFKALEKFFATQNNIAPANSGASPTANATDSYAATTSTRAQELCVRYCNQLGLKMQCEKVSAALAEKIAELGALAGRSPLSVAAACIYMTSYLMKHPRTAKDISNVAGVSDGTIRTAYKVLYGARDKLIDPDWIKDGKGDMKLLPVVQ